MNTPEVSEFIRACCSGIGVILMGVINCGNSTLGLHKATTTGYCLLHRTHIMLSKVLLSLLLVTIVAFFSAQSVEAAKTPRVTHKVYFDIKHGEENLGRVVIGLYGGVSLL